MAPVGWGCHDHGMDWITAWLDGVPDTWLRAGALAGLTVGFIALGMGIYQMVTGLQANRRLRDIQQENSEIKKFLFKKFGKRIEIRASFKGQIAETTTSIEVRRKKKSSFLLTLRRLLGKLLP